MTTSSVTSTPPPVASGSSLKPRPPWGFIELTGWMAILMPAENLETVILRRPADGYILAKQAGKLEKHQPVLLIMCGDRRTSVSIVNGCPLDVLEGSDSAHVDVAIDDAPFHTERWLQSPDLHTLLAPGPAEFAQTLLKARRLRCRFSPFGMPAQTATFILAPQTDHLIYICGKLGGW